MAVEDFEPLAEQIVAGAGKLAAAACGWFLLVAEFDAAEACVWFGMPSTAWWLAHTCGLSRRTAVEHVKVARALATHPRLAEEMGAGRLSYSHVRAIARAAHPGEDQLVSDLIDIARHGTVAHLERIVRGLRTVEDNETPGPRDERERVTRGWGHDSMWRLSARLDPERGALVDAALDQIARAEGLSAPDALLRLAEIGAAALADDVNPPRSLRGDERAAVVIHLDVTQLAEQRARSAERARPVARIAGGPGLPARTMQRLLCASRARVVVRDGEKVLDVGRSRRLVTDRQYRALLIRHDGTCAYPGCANTRALEAHHVVHWLDGGPTDMKNLVLLCEPHHLAHHAGEYAITALPGQRFQFLSRDGATLPGGPSLHVGDKGATIDGEFDHIDPNGATPRWDGQRLNLDYAVSVLAIRRADDAATASRAVDAIPA